MFDSKAYMKQYRKKSYEFMKEHGICTRCQKEKAEPGKTMCSSCLEAAIERMKPCNNPQQHKKKQKERYYRLKEAALCICCGKQNQYDGTVRCMNCLLKHRIKYKEQDIKRGHNKQFKERGLCIKCGGGIIEGRNICESCLEKMQELAEQNFAPFRKQNAENFKKHWA